MLNEQIITKIEAIPCPKMTTRLWLGKPRSEKQTIFFDDGLMEKFIYPYCSSYIREGKDRYLLDFDERYDWDEFINYLNAIIVVIAESTKKEKDNIPKKKSNVGIVSSSNNSYYHSLTIDCPEEFQDKVGQYGSLRKYDNHKNRFILDVDSRFDFDEVKQYILSL